MIVTVVFALPAKQWSVEVELAEGATVADAIHASRIGERSAHPDIERLTLGVWGQVVDRDWVLHDGDRVELYRPLSLDPREARRRLAESGRSLGRRPAPKDEETD